MICVILIKRPRDALRHKVNPITDGVGIDIEKPPIYDTINTKETMYTIIFPHISGDLSYNRSDEILPDKSPLRNKNHANCGILQSNFYSG